MTAPAPSFDAALATAIAQAVCSAALSRIAADTILVLGGIGFAWKHQAHPYFKRATTDATLLGTAEEHRAASPTWYSTSRHPNASRGWPPASRAESAPGTGAGESLCWRLSP